MAARTLADLADGDETTILRVGGDGALRQRLMDMGVTRGAAIRVERRAPLGDPIEVTVKGYLLAIRERDGRHIDVE